MVDNLSLVNFYQCDKDLLKRDFPREDLNYGNTECHQLIAQLNFIYTHITDLKLQYVIALNVGLNGVFKNLI